MTQHIDPATSGQQTTESNESTSQWLTAFAVGMGVASSQVALVLTGDDMSIPGRILIGTLAGTTGGILGAIIFGLLRAAFRNSRA